MSAAWAASSAGIILIGACTVLLWVMRGHGQRLPSSVHPYAHRLIIIGMFTGGDAVALTALGTYPEAVIRWAASFLGPAGHDVLVIAALILLAAAVAGLAFVPAADVAVIALALPFVALEAGGHLQSLDFWLPVTQWSQDISTWLGG